ncbi:MAG: hypothetical protein IJM50_00395 [Lachnospiraceae bacterium]|nr:hypothetical protein [Lachnospiraceae bacterium]
MKKTRFRRLLAFLILTAVLTAAFPSSALADGAEGPPSQPFSEDVPVKTQQIHLPFVSLGHKHFEWDFPYSDQFFTVSSSQLSLGLARASIGLAISAFRNDSDPLENQYDTYLGAAGFSRITPFGYDEPTSKSSLSGVIAMKKIGGFTLIAAAPCGQGYGKEWGGNMYVGDGERHAGFDEGARILESKIDEFILENKLDGPLKLWVTGFSRAAAVGNLTAADMIASGRFEDVFAYLFGVPRTTRNPVYYDGIFNICGKYDPVTQVAPESWGFERYGVDYFTPAEETDTLYALKSLRAGAVCRAISGDVMRNNPEVNYQLHMIIEFLAEMFPTSGEYCDVFQDVLVRIMTEKTPDSLLEALLSALSSLDRLDRRREYSSRVLEDYLSHILSQHLEADPKQVSEGRWDPDASVGINLMREHLPLTYVSWLFSSDRLQDFLYGPSFTRRVVINADADVEVLLNGQIVGGARRDGGIISPERADSDEDPEGVPHAINAVRDGKKTVVNLPMNDIYVVRIRTYGLTNVSYYDVICSPHTTFGTADKLHVFAAKEGEYEFAVRYAKELDPPVTVRGSATHVREMDFSYSTTIVMADEAGASRHVSLKSLLQLAFGALIFTVLVLLFCLVISLIHRRGRKKTGKQYSDLYVIVPHLLLAALLAVLTVFFTVNMFSIGAARSVFAGLTVFVLFLLALRGTLKDHRPFNIAVTVFLLLVSLVNGFIYQRSALVTATVAHAVIYGVSMAMLALLSVLTFRKGKQVRDPSARVSGE